LGGERSVGRHSFTLLWEIYKASSEKAKNTMTKHLIMLQRECFNNKAEFFAGRNPPSMVRYDRVNTTLLLELRDNLFAMRKLLKIQTNKTATRTLNRTNFLSKSTIEYLVQN
jgi:hypothetical protein